MSSQLAALLQQSRRPKILVVGDVMLDRYLWGDVDRVSVEAPIPVLSVDHREDRLGGAGSVVAILSALEADVVVGGIVGDDPDGAVVQRLLRDLGAEVQRTLVIGRRVTTVKERLLGRTQGRHPQQMARVDREDTTPIDDTTADSLMRGVAGHLDDIDLVLISDYEKGVCSSGLPEKLLAKARARGVPAVADPARGVDYRRYVGSTCVTPNRVEAGLATGVSVAAPRDGLEAARRLLHFGFESVVITLDRDGIAWSHADGRSGLFPVKARQVYDITGAGDAVLSALGLGIALGADWPAAIELANLAGGLEVQKLGVAPLTRGELLDELTGVAFSTGHKIVSTERLEVELRERRRLGQQIVMTNGCFDLFHPGHLACLQYARSQGDCLVVGLNSDRSVAQLKGKGRPIVGERGRAEMVAALGCVDYVVTFDDTSVAGLVERVAPHVLVKAAQYAPEEVVGHELVESYGGRVVLAPMEREYSTSQLIGRIRELECEEVDASPRAASTSG